MTAPPFLNSLIARLSDRFGPEVLDASAAVHCGREVVARQLARLRRYRLGTVVEIGTRHGVMAAVFARLAERVVTIDLHASPLVADVLACAGAANVLALRVRSDAAKALLLDGLDFDLAFIDGDHTVAGAALDFEHTRRCGRLLFHDYADPGFHGVTDFVDSLDEGTVICDAPFAWWFAPGVEPFDGRVGPRSVLFGTPLCIGV